MRRLSPFLLILAISCAAIAALSANARSEDDALASTTPLKRAPLSADSFLDEDAVKLIVRLDDIGMCHAVNVAFDKVASDGIVTAASVMVVTPWLDEAVEVLKRHPDVSVGVHLCLNAEWVNYRWGPVLPVSEVPSLVDEDGYFYGMRKQFNEANPSLEEIDKELRAQVDLALSKGLKLSYIDHHMGTAGETPERQAILENIAKDYGIGISRWFGEKQAAVIYSVEPEKKADALIEGISKIDSPGTYLVVGHAGMDYPEMAVMEDIHAWAPKPMAKHREAESMSFTDPRLPQLIEEKGITLVGYDDYQRHGLHLLRNPNYDVPQAPKDENKKY